MKWLSYKIKQKNNSVVLKKDGTTLNTWLVDKKLTDNELMELMMSYIINKAWGD